LVRCSHHTFRSKVAVGDFHHLFRSPAKPTTIGPLSNLTGGNDAKTWFEGDGGIHSQKPCEIYAIVEELAPVPLLFELFSRGAPREGWDLHGNVVGKIPAAPIFEEALPATDQQWRRNHRSPQKGSSKVASHESNIADAVSVAFTEIAELATEC
jgi:hypothetical protein